MGLFTNAEFNSLDDLFLEQLKDLYDAEHRLTKALPKMADTAHHPQLKKAFQDHLKETKNHVTRLEQVFEILGKPAERQACQAMKGLIEEGDEILSAKGNDDVRDAGLIAAAQRVEHYEMAGYGTVRTFAQRLGYDDVARLLQQTLDEEGAADQKLTQIAESTVNVHAHR
jgi:ferritin-like metal-binding protein YciE